jgi:hypothetical protein
VNTMAYARVGNLQGGRSTVKSDMYSLGLLVYMLTRETRIRSEATADSSDGRGEDGCPRALPASVKPKLAQLFRWM